MKRYWMVVGSVLIAFLAVFLIFEHLQITYLADPLSMMGAGSIAAALIGIVLLRRMSSCQFRPV